MMMVYADLVMACSVEEAYRAWQPPQDLGMFLAGIRTVREEKEGVYRMESERGGSAWSAKVVDDFPGVLFRWARIDGDAGGTVRFYRRPDDTCKLVLELHGPDVRSDDARVSLQRFLEHGKLTGPLLEPA